MTKTANIPCLFSADNTVLSSNLVPVSIVLLHDSINRKGTRINLDTIKAASEGIKNKPILAYITKDENGEDDFAGHEIAVEVTDDMDKPVKITYYEQPIGVIPESTKIEFFEGDDGLTYMKCTGYIYENYSNEALDIIKKTDGKCVSAELRINSGFLDNDGIYEIETFDFLGVTILSDTRTPAMNENCRIELFEEEPTYQKFLSKALEDVKMYELKTLDSNSGENAENEGSKVKEESAGENVEDKNITEIEETEVQEEETSPTQEEISPDEINNEGTGSAESEKTEDAGEEPEEVTSSDEGVEGEPNEPQEDTGETQINFSVFDDLINVKVSSMEELRDTVSNILEQKDKEIADLYHYKRLHDSSMREAEIKEILIGIDFECEEFKECIEKAMSFEIDIEDFKKEVYAIYGMKMSEAKRNAKKNVNFSTEKIFINNGETARVEEITKHEAPYANIFKNIL